MKKIQKSSIFSNFIKSFDLMPTPIGLRLYGNTSIKSIVGALISILSLLGAILLSLESFQDFIYYRKPVITFGTVYRSSNSTGINFSSKDLYFAMTIYDPINPSFTTPPNGNPPNGSSASGPPPNGSSASGPPPNGPSSSGAPSNGPPPSGSSPNGPSLSGIIPLNGPIPSPPSPENNYDNIKYFDLNFKCIDCDENKIEFKLNLCNLQEFDEIVLDSLPKPKQLIFLNIFKNFSLCLPDGFSGTIDDFDIEKHRIKLNRLNLAIDEMLKIDSTLTLDAIQVNKNVEVNGVKYNYNKLNNAFGNDIKIKNSNTQILTDNILSSKRLLQTNPPPTSQTNPPPSNQTNPPPTSQTNPPPTSQTNPPSISQTNPPSTSQTNPPPTSQTNPPPTSQINPQNNNTNPPSTSQTNLQNNQSQQDQINQLKEQFKQLEQQVLEINPKLGENTYFRKETKKLINNNNYPKFLFIMRNFRINPLANINLGEQIYRSSFEFEIIDMKDSLTGSFKKYNIFIQENEIEITTPYMFFSETKQTHRILTISKIEDDILSQNVIENDFSRFSFKTTNEIPKISIRFYLFNDWLSSFGSFFNLCMLLASILIGFFQEAVLNSNIVNSLFELLDNNEKNFKLSVLTNGGNKYIDIINQNIKKTKKKLKSENKDQDAKIKDFIFTKEEIEKYYEYDVPLKDEDVLIYDNIQENNDLIESKKNKKINNNSPNPNCQVKNLNLKLDAININEIELSVKNTKSKLQDFNSNKDKDIKGKINKNSLDIRKYNCENICVIENLKECSEKSELKGKFDIKTELDLKRPNQDEKIKIEEKFALIRKMKKIKKIAMNKIIISPEKFWIYNSCKFCKCLFNKDKVFIAGKSTDLLTKNIEISEIIKKHFEIDFIKKLLLTEDELELFKFQFKYLNISNMDLTKEYLNNLYTGHLKEDYEEDYQNEYFILLKILFFNI